MEGREFVEELWKMLDPVVASEGMDIIELEFQRESNGYVLRLYVDHPDGVTLEDCSRVSRVLSDFLDVVDPIHHAYNLEVSSPGLNRPLRKPEHFEKFLGSVVKIKTLEPLENRRNFKGILIETSGDMVSVECDGVVFTIPVSMIDKARLLYFETEELKKKKSMKKGRVLPFRKR